MTDPVVVTAILFGGMFVVLALGVPIAFALGGLSVGLIQIFWSSGALNMLPIKAYNTASSFELLSIPLFIFMAAMLQRSGVAEDLYESISRFFGSVRGGLAVGTIIICTIFAAMAGISGAATITMGLIALPVMLARNYDKGLALGSIAAGGSLGILIPPSVTMIIYGLVANTSIGKLYAGGVLPGLLLAFIFIVYILIRGWMQPQAVGTVDRSYSWGEKFAALKGLIVPFALVVGVLGSMLTGVASVSESAAVGAAGAVVATALRRRLTWGLFREACDETLLLSCLMFWIMIGASALSTFYTGMGAGRLIESMVLGLEVNRYVILIGIQIVLALMGMVLDTVGIIMITAPIFVPIVVKLGFDPVWFGVLFIINMELGFLTPPFGYNLFYLRGVVPPEVSMLDIYKSVVPFVFLMIFAIGVCIAFPQIILALPNALF